MSRDESWSRPRREVMALPSRWRYLTCGAKGGRLMVMNWFERRERVVRARQGLSVGVGKVERTLSSESISW